MSVRSALLEVESAKRRLAEARGRLDRLDSELVELESQGLSEAELDQVTGRLRDLGYPLTEATAQSVNQLLMTLNQGLANSSQTLETETQKADQLQQVIATSLGLAETGVLHLKAALGRLKERLVATEISRAKLAGFSSTFPWSGTRPVVELALEAESIRRVAAELQAALGREKQAQAVVTESGARKDRLQ